MKNKINNHKPRYPKKSILVLFWIVIGGVFLGVVIFAISIAEIFALGNLILWLPFFIGTIFYTRYYKRQGKRHCTNCGEIAHKGKKFCDKCGASIFWQCPKCHTRTSRKNIACKNCGQLLNVVIFAKQIKNGFSPQISNESVNYKEKVVVSGSLMQFCPACGAEITKNTSCCTVCGSRLNIEIVKGI